jgi:hypothetical protein
MGDVGNVEQAERNRQAEADGRVETANQHTGYYRIKQQIH